MLISLIALGCPAESTTTPTPGMDAAIDGGPRSDARLDAVALEDVSRPDGASGCVVDQDCDNGVFCDGVVRCDPRDPRADSNGCLPLEPACAAGLQCNEGSRSCGCGDTDGDGDRPIECGGGDCDDSDPGRYAGNTERCDPRDRDEDCDPRTFGVRDADEDGSSDALCCNVDPDTGMRRCGSDCDDTRDDVGPGAAELCNMRDDDCDGEEDEGARALFYQDSDGDSFGSMAPGAPTMMGCLPAPAGVGRQRHRL